MILLDDVGDTSNALQCISDLSGCCLGRPVIGHAGRGQWFYPNETQVPNNNAGYGFYRSRGSNGQVFLRRRSHITSPTGTYCCQVPTAGSDPNDETFCAFLSELINFTEHNLVHVYTLLTQYLMFLTELSMVQVIIVQKIAHMSCSLLCYTL